jgi:hypothetical protein
MPGLSDLIADSSAELELIIKGNYLDENDDEQVIWISRSGWADEPDGPAGTYIRPLADFNLVFDAQMDPLDPKTLSEGFRADITLINNSVYYDYAGMFDGWWQYSVDQQPWNIYLVGILSDGTRVTLSDVISTPLYQLYGQLIPEAGSDTCTIRTISKHAALDKPLQPVTYSPPCLLFPGTVSGVINLGDNLDISGSQSISFWVYLSRPSQLAAVQYIIHKDGGTTGYYVAVGLVGGGTVEGGVEVGIRGQTPAVTTTSAGVIKAFRWHRIDIAIAAASRRIDIDGTTAVTTSGITGSPVVNSVDCIIGRNLGGRLHRLLFYTDVRTNATMKVEGRTPITGRETNLREAFIFQEGKGPTVSSSKSGSSLVNITLGTGVVWDTASWHLESILSQYEPLIVGTVPRAPVTWFDTANQIGQLTRGSLALVQEVQANHNSVSTANYSVNYDNGTFRVTTGVITSLTWSATATANNLWGPALLSTAAVATINCPAGSRGLAIQCRPDTTDSSFRFLIGWQGNPGTLAGAFLIRLNVGAVNRLSAVAINDAGGLFQVNYDSLEQDRTYSIAASMNATAGTLHGQPANTLYLYVDGEMVASVAISGTWTTVLTNFGVGIRPITLTTPWVGRYDGPAVFNTVISQSQARLLHTSPLTGAETGLTNAWRLNETSGTSAAALAGGTALTLTSPTRVPGRSAPVDLARFVLFSAGYTESDLDTDSWRECLNEVSADCGWSVTNAQKSRDVLNIVLANLGFLLYEELGKWKIRRFVGLTGSPDVELKANVDLQAGPIEPSPADPAIYQWTILYATNNAKVQPANLSVNPATEPDRYTYAQMDNRAATKTDYAVLDRFPAAEPRTRLTALLTQKDAEAEAARLLPIHKHGADRKVVSLFANVGSVSILDEIGPLVAEADLRDGDVVVVGISTSDGVGTIAIWRPAGQ